MKTKKKILVIFGTRPEAIKLAPVCLAVRKNPDLELLICNTGQQRDMAEKTLSFFCLKSDYDLDVMQQAQTLFDLQARLMEKLSSLLADQPVDGIIVQGDTMSAFCGALAGFYGRIPVFHVEAGLRSESLSEPFPEEGLRQMLSRITTLHFAPSAEAEKNLLRENIAADRIFITGNTVIDALYSLAPEQYVNAAAELEKTERMEGVEKGCAFLAGADTEMICQLAEKFLSSPQEKSRKENPYGDGNAAEKIVAKLVDFYNAERK